MKKNIFVKGARTHNLKNINVEIPRNKLVTITGLSGSGKSSLAFDTIFAEGQRRYMESLSSYARQFLSMMDKPDVDVIEGLSPAISIEQKSSSHNPRSTVGTVTEIYDYLRLLYARIGIPKCPEHQIELKAMSVDDMARSIFEKYSDANIMILAPIVKNQKGEHIKLLESLSQQGYRRVRINDEIIEIIDITKNLLNPKAKNNIELVIDRLKVSEENKLRITESIETASNVSNGIVCIYDAKSKKLSDTFSTKHSCPVCGFSVSELEPKLFSFNSPAGACEACDGLGVKEYFDPNKIIVNQELSLSKGAIYGWDEKSAYYNLLLKSLSEHYKVNIDTPYHKLSEKFKKILFFGSGDEVIKMKYVRGYRKRDQSDYVIKEEIWEGVIKKYEKQYENGSYSTRDRLAKYLSTDTCSECSGTRLNEKSRNVIISNKSISDITSLTTEECYGFFKNLKLEGMKKEISKKIIFEITSRLSFLVNVGLNYLTLDRSAETLSGGEAQRIRLASQIGSGLVGVMYILDEPSIGLHQRDNDKLLQTLANLRELGNTVIVVEHDEDTILSSDYVVDVGPGAGNHGGQIVYSGIPSSLTTAKNSLTGEYISGKKYIPVPKHRTKASKQRTLKIFNATHNNLKNIDVEIPIGLMTCVTGVSGSGKSSLINNVLFTYIVNDFLGKDNSQSGCKHITGLEHIDKIIEIDQSPIGRTPRSNPATYTGIFSHIRDLFTQTQEARARGYKAGRFSFNVKGGRCDACDGDGVIRVEMHFLSDVYVKCDKCDGKRYNDQTLEILFKGKNINDVLNFTVSEALEFFENIPIISKKLEILDEVGLSYIKLGQNATTLSGGEAQRIKLAKELIKRDTGKTLYVLDEPTTGLHFHDVYKLLQVLDKLKSRGNTLIVIEHNLEVIKTADWIIDLGPEGGINGGAIVTEGTPEYIAQQKKSHTGRFLKTKLK
ncbi:MAG: excinuclease ABC subunit A [Gammaproteobacteria bacterium]|nr:excinuclease ABC subunit A [Gammaproteobacteria bacterium]